MEVGDLVTYMDFDDEPPTEHLGLVISFEEAGVFVKVLTSGVEKSWPRWQLDIVNKSKKKKAFTE